MRAFSIIKVLFVLGLFVTSSAQAEITWLPTESTYNGTPFASAGFPGIGVTTTGTPAYGAGGNSSGVYVFGFSNAMLSGLPTFSQSELGSTVLSAGTALVLVFSKASTDNVNFTALLADASQTISFELVSETQIRIRANIVDPVESASGNAAAAFGLVMSYADNDALDFKGTVFATNMHYLDLASPSDSNAGTAGINGNGVNGVTVDFNAYLPLQFLSTFGITEANVSEVNGYIDGVAVPAGSFTNQGLDSSLGFNFNDSSNPNNTVLKVKVTNASWSAHTIGFGRLDETAPTITVTGKLKRTVTTDSTSVKGTVTDTTGVYRLLYSTKNSTTGFKTASVKSEGAWSLKLSKLVKGKTAKLYLKAVDILGNTSSVTTVQVKRR